MFPICCCPQAVQGSPHPRRMLWLQSLIVSRGVCDAPVSGRSLGMEKRFPGTNPTAGDGDTSLTLLAGDCYPGLPTALQGSVWHDHQSCSKHLKQRSICSLSHLLDFFASKLLHGSPASLFHLPFPDYLPHLQLSHPLPFLRHPLCIAQVFIFSFS